MALFSGLLLSVPLDALTQDERDRASCDCANGSNCVCHSINDNENGLVPGPFILSLTFLENESVFAFDLLK